MESAKIPEGVHEMCTPPTTPTSVGSSGTGSSSDSVGLTQKFGTNAELGDISFSQSRRLMTEMMNSIRNRRPKLSSRKYSRMCDFVEACLKGSIHTVVYYLYKNYLNVNDELLCHMSALHHACYYGQIEVVKVLLEAGAKPNYKRKSDSLTPLMAAACFNGPENDNLVECVKTVVAAGGKIDVATTDGMTALLYAASRSHLRIVEFFLDKGADIDHISIEGNTAMKYAEDNGDHALKALVQRHMWVDPEIPQD